MKANHNIIVGVLVALCFGVALYIRVYFPYEQVFGGEWIKFTSIDAYWHMRIVDNLVHNIHRTIFFDPYFIYPEGKVVVIQLFNPVLARVIWLIGLGSPSQHTIDVVGAYFPAVSGALIVIPVYFIGRELCNRWVGLLSASLIAVLPGEFLARSMLGFTDYHVVEVLLTTVTILFLVLAIKAGRESNLPLPLSKGKGLYIKTLVYSLLAGVFLGIYLITWAGGLLFVFIISLYFIVQCIIDHLRRKPTGYLCVVGVSLFMVAFLIYLPSSLGAIYTASVVVAVCIPLGLYITSRLMNIKEIKVGYYPLALVGLGLASLVVFYMVKPDYLQGMLEKFSVFFPVAVSLTTTEMQPLFFPDGNFSFASAVGNFTTSVLLVPVSLCILVYLTIKKGSSEITLLVVWSLVILAMTLAQTRFCYYFAVNVALLTGYLLWLVIERVGIKGLKIKSTNP